MAIDFKVVERGNPSKPQDPKKFYASANISGETTMKEMCTEIERLTALSKGDALSAISAFLEIIPGHLADGKSVRLGDLGNFRIGISSEGALKEVDVTHHSIKSSKIIFTASKDFKKILPDLKYHKKN